MPRNVSATFVEAINAAETEEAFLVLMKLSHPDLGDDDPLRLTGDSVPTWSADQDSDTAEDKTGNGNDGTLVNGPTWTSEGPNDDLRGALSFDETQEQSIDFGNPSDIYGDRTELTIELMVNPDSTSTTDQRFAEHGSNINDSSRDASGWKLWGGQCAVRRQDSEGNVIQNITGSANPPAGEWSRYSFVFKGGQFVRTYIDGELDDENTTDIMAAFDEPLTNGLRLARLAYTATQWYPGRATDFRIWNTARTQQQIQDNMNTRLNGDEAGLVGYWPLNDTTDKYEPFPFKVALPKETDDLSGALAHLQTDAVDRRIIDAVRRIQGIPDLDMEVVLSSDPDSIELTWPTFKLSNARYTKTKVEGDLVLELLEQEPFPGDSVNPSTFPGCF